MLVKQSRTDLAIKRAALARIAQIDAELSQPSDTTDIEALRAERDGLVGSWNITEEVEMPGVITPEQAADLAQEQAREAQRQAIIAELAANDAKALRALFAGETDRVAEHNARQAKLRAQLQAI